MDVTIVGGSGYVGFNLANYLNDKHNVTIADVNIPKTDFNTVYCDLTNLSGEARKQLSSSDVIINTAIIQIPQINEESENGYNVNIRGLQKLLDIADRSSKTKGLIQAGSWHSFGENDYRYEVNEQFGYRPHNVDDRAKLYTLCKTAQEMLVKYYDNTKDTNYRILRLGTVLGEGMPKGTAASIFINNALNDKSITPFKHSQYRPMLYVDIKDVCKAFGLYVDDIENDLPQSLNVLYPEPITIRQLAKGIEEMVPDSEVKVIDKDKEKLYDENDSNFAVDDSTSQELGIDFRHPSVPLKRIIEHLK